ncbi:hypothetical protein F4810DRAFT_539184 [Camillea tinctor]|nr:hypothetical protein F4810DRAFT_539184 [Camillea tinctor]
MSAPTRIFTLLSRRPSCALRVPPVTMATTRSTSWIAFEQPNPSLYTSPRLSPPKEPKEPNQTQTQTQGEQATTITPQDSARGTRHVGEATVAPSTVALPASHQEVSTSGKTLPPTIPGPPPHRRGFHMLWSEYAHYRRHCRATSSW